MLSLFVLVGLDGGAGRVLGVVVLWFGCLNASGPDVIVGA